MNSQDKDKQISNKYPLLTYGQSLLNMMPQHIKKISIINDQLILHTDRDYIIELLDFLKNHSNCQFKQLVDICGVDYPEKKERFEVVYSLLSIQYNARIRVKLTTDEITPVPSATQVFKSANWFERETWDMYGVFFSNHPDLRRILTDYGFDGFPLRKDFPLTGYVEVRYDDEQKRVITEPLELTQEFRRFDYSSPWEQNRNR